MITNGEFEIKMVVAVDKKSQVLPPCGVCREFMMLLRHSSDLEILVGRKRTVVRLKKFNTLFLFVITLSRFKHFCRPNIMNKNLYSL